VNYLNTAAGGTNAANPVALTIDIDLAGSGWSDILSAIAGAASGTGKYVALDLSACDMTGMTGTPGEFAPGTADTGERKIVSLVLPDDAVSVKAGTSSSPTFKNFNVLTSVSAKNVEIVGKEAFVERYDLKTVSFPKATSIGEYAFYGTALTTVNLPEAATIGEYAFYGTALTTVNLPKTITIGKEAFSFCHALETVDFPKAITIGKEAFFGCDSLETVSLPKVTSIGDSTFYSCTALKRVNLSAATSIGERAFYNCTALETADLSAATTIGEEAFYLTGGTPLTVTLGNPAPTLGGIIPPFYNNFSGKTVTVRVPSGALGSYDSAWQTNFCSVSDIALTITTY
jgi:hypothetical protein